MRQVMDDLREKYAAYEAARLALSPQDRLQQDGLTKEQAAQLVAATAELGEAEAVEALNAPTVERQQARLSGEEAKRALLSDSEYGWARLVVASGEGNLVAITALELIAVGAPLDSIWPDLERLLPEGSIRALTVTVSQSWAEVNLGALVTARQVALAKGAK